MSAQSKFIYKYFDQEQYCDDFLNKGRVLFRHLSYFLTCENKRLQDETEHLRVYQPSGGLTLKIEGRVVDATIPDGAMVFKISNPEKIFIYCTSIQFSPDLFQRFNAKFCIKIDREKFDYHIDKQLKRKFKWGYKYLKDTIVYYNRSLPDEIREGINILYSTPEKIVFSKPLEFTDESEFRFAFSQDKNIFNVDNLQYFPVNYPLKTSEPVSNIKMFLELGNIERFCQKLSSSNLGI